MNSTQWHFYRRRKRERVSFRFRLPPNTQHNIAPFLCLKVVLLLLSSHSPDCSRLTAIVYFVRLVVASSSLPLTLPLHFVKRCFASSSLFLFLLPKYNGHRLKGLTLLRPNDVRRLYHFSTTSLKKTRRTCSSPRCYSSARLLVSSSRRTPTGQDLPCASRLVFRHRRGQWTLDTTR